MGSITVRSHARRKPAKAPDPFQPQIDRLIAIKRGEGRDKADDHERATRPATAPITRIAERGKWLAAEQGGMQ